MCGSPRRVGGARKGLARAVFGEAINAAPGRYKRGVRRWHFIEKRPAKPFFGFYCLQRLVKEDYIRCCMLTFFYLLSAVCLSLCALSLMPLASIVSARRSIPPHLAGFRPSSA